MPVAVPATHLLAAQAVNGRFKQPVGAQKQVVTKPLTQQSS